MKFGRQKKVSTDIEDYYSIKVRSIWEGLKQESPAFWWLCIYVFFEYVRPQTIYPAIDILPWAQLALLLTIITAYNEKGREWVKNTENTLFILLTIIIMLSCVFAFSPSTSWSKINTPINWLILYFLIINIVNTEKRFLVFTLLFLLVSFKMSQHGFRSFAMRGFAFANWGAAGGPGWFSDSADFGVQLTIFIPLSIAFIAALKEYWARFKRIFFYLMPFTGVFSIAATSSRGAQLGLAMAGVMFILKSRAGIKALLGVLVIGGVLYAILPAEQKERFQTIGDDPTSISRLDHWEYGMDVVRDHPFLGIGYANWLKHCWFENPNGIGEQKKCLNPHSLYVQGAAEIGLPGLGVFLLMALLVFRQNARTREYAKQINNKFILYIAYGLDGGLVGYMVSGFFLTIFFYPFFWMQLSMAVALHAIAKKQVAENVVEQ